MQHKMHWGKDIYSGQIAEHGEFTVEVVDSVDCYVNLMKSIFDFPAMETFLKGFPILLDALNGGLIYLQLFINLSYS